MDVALVIIGVVLMLVGLAGCVLPFLPGPPLCYAALLIQQWQSQPPYSTRFLVIWAAITLVVTVLDYVVPLYGTKRFGGTRYGLWGCTLGLIAGLFFPPWGLIVGPFLGALVGELLGQAESGRALRAAWGSFMGFLFGTLLKLIACLVMAWYLIEAF